MVALPYNFSFTSGPHLFLYNSIVFFQSYGIASFVSNHAEYGVTSEMEEQIPLRLFQVYIIYYSPRPNVLLVKTINLSIIHFMSRRTQTVAQTKH